MEQIKFVIFAYTLGFSALGGFTLFLLILNYRLTKKITHLETFS